MDLERTLCCDKRMCVGCLYAQLMHEKLVTEAKCAFCRLPIIDVKVREEMEPDVIRRAAAGDVSSLNACGRRLIVNGDNIMAVRLFNKSAELGDPEGFFYLSYFYRPGEGRQMEHDEVGRKMYLFCLKSAAIGGHPDARYRLGVYEWDEERFDTATLHWTIASNLGHTDSVQKLKKCYKEGYLRKDDFAAALRAHQAAVDATKSPQRKEAYEFFRTCRERRNKAS